MIDCSDNNNESTKQPAASIIPSPMMCAPFEKKTIQSWEEMRQAEDLLSAELNNLTVKERAEAMDDLHCLGEELTVETLEVVQEMLEEFDGIVHQLQNPSYNMAVNQNRAYVEDPSFRLRFLRCNLYDVHRSVSQMMDFLKYKAAYFGEDKLSREITLEDLNDEDMKLMLSGRFHIQKERDRSGRVILHVTGGRWESCKIENMIRVSYYVWNNILVPNLEVQMKGICCVSYDVTIPGENYIAPGFNFMRTASNVLAAFPLRFSATHVSVKPATGYLALKNRILSYTFKVFSRHTRARTRLHYGSDIEMQYYLRSHGIPTQSFPVDLDGNFCKDDILNAWFYEHKEDIQAQKLPSGDYPAELVSVQQETETSAQIPYGSDGENVGGKPTAVMANEGTGNSEEGQWSQPSAQDVLLGRGWKIQNHEGNVRFRTFLVAHSDEYDSAPRLRKRVIAREYVNILRRQGVRFWKQVEDGDAWVESTMEEAENKVGQMFRTMRKNAKT